MLMVTPCTDWYLIFTGIAKGNIALSATILPLNLILQILLLLVYLLIFNGTTDIINLAYLGESVLIVLIIPFILSLITKYLLKNKSQLKDNLVAKISVLPIIFLKSGNCSYVRLSRTITAQSFRLALEDNKPHSAIFFDQLYCKSKNRPALTIFLR